MTIHEFKCDGCCKRVKANFNGEHFLPPKDWVRLYSDDKAEVLDYHLCGDCKPKERRYRRERET